MRNLGQPGGENMVEYAQPLFSEEHRVKGPTRRRVLKTLTRVWEHLRISDQDGANTRRVTVIEPPEDNNCRIEVHESRPAVEQQARFNTGDRVRVASTDNGIRIGSWGHIENMATHRDYLSYTLVLEGDTYRQERRNAFRVPIENDDDVHAEIVLPPSDAPIECQVHDLSMTGAWLELSGESDSLANIEPGTDTPCVIALTLPTSREIVRSDARAIWTKWSENDGLYLGVTWDQPQPEFSRDLRRFVMHKERELSQRRART